MASLEGLFVTESASLLIYPHAPISWGTCLCLLCATMAKHGRPVNARGTEMNGLVGQTLRLSSYIWQEPELSLSRDGRAELSWSHTENNA